MSASPRSPVFAPVDAPSTLEHTLERLGTAIRIGLLPPGSRLPPERELADHLDISRSTLRQALATLTEQGHLRAVRGRAGGTFVSEAPPLASSTPFPLEAARTVLDWRMALELGTVQLAAERATDEQRAALREAAATAPDDWASFRRSDAAFHLSIAEAANSDRVVAAMTQVQGELSDMFARMPSDSSSRDTVVTQHRAVAEAVAGGDGEQARAAMRTHLEFVEQLLGQSLS